MTVGRVEPLRGRAGWGVAAECDAMRVLQPRPVGAAMSGAAISGRSRGYFELDRAGDGLRGLGEVALRDGARVTVCDEWRPDGDCVRATRTVAVRGEATGGFLTWLRVGLDNGQDASAWQEVEPFAPGVAYGDAPRVAARAIAGLPARQAGVRWVLVREDRLSAPVFAVRRRDGRWVAVLHANPDATTIVADGASADGGETLIDERQHFASLGGVAGRSGLELGAWFPGTEGQMTYSAGGLPLLQLARWRRRYHPIREGIEQRYELAFRFGRSEGVVDFYRRVWRWAWEVFAPDAEPCDADEVVRACTAVLADQARSVGRGPRRLSGIPLEADAVRDTGEESRKAVMGFVGANTDCAYLLLRTGGKRERALGAAILDSFADIGLEPPLAEGFDLDTGALTTYRTFAGRPAVYSRSIAEGCHAALRASAWEAGRGRDRRAWLRWARVGGDWLLHGQDPTGALPRAWVAGTGEVIDPSTSSSHVVVPFLVALARATCEPAYLEAARRAGDYAWRSAGATGGWTGATLDNPDVVDKEAAVIALEGFMDLHDATGESVWLERAAAAAALAESWIYVWNVPMPVDGDDADLPFKRGVPTVGFQLIATGVSMTDGFLAVNAAAFARLHAATDDRHALAVARLVTHATKSMLALPGRPFDLRGPGWQQEHWSFAVRRGYGLNRRWLPWVAVAHALGILRLHDLGPELADRVLGGA